MIGSFETTFLLLVATSFLAAVTVGGYRRTGDPLHPTVFLGPLFFLGMVAEPAQRLLHPNITGFFPAYEGLGYAMFVQYLGMACLFWGILSVRGPRRQTSSRSSVIDLALSHHHRTQIRSMALLIAAFALLGFWTGIYNAGGFVSAYDSAKGGGVAMSGYLGEAQNLSIAALVIFALGCQRRPIHWQHIAIGIMMASPLLIHGIFGGRRGPLFLSLTSLFTAYWIARGRLPRPSVIALAFALIIGAIIFMQSQRGHLYLGSDEGIRWDGFVKVAQGEEIGAGDNFIVSSGAVIAVSELNTFHWGRRFFTTYFVRPIPRQIWPDKYEDVTQALYGRSFADVRDDFYGWAAILGWRPLTGFATNTVVDLFMEFSWLYLFALWGLGRFIGIAWRNFRGRGGYWFVVYVAIAALSVYLPTQSFSAFAHRLLYLTVVTLILWRFYFGRVELASDRTPPMTPAPRTDASISRSRETMSTNNGPQSVPPKPSGP